MTLKAVLIGSGNAASFHAHAFREAGFVLRGVLSRNNSTSVKEFVNKFNIPNTFSNIDEVLDSKDEWDVALVACPTEFSFGYVCKLIKSGKPILAEKPISYDLDDLDFLQRFSNIKVAFNRRYYETVDLFKDNIVAAGFGNIKVNIPEKSSKISSPGALPYLVYENSIHIFDILNYCFGEIDWKSASSVSSNSNELISVTALGSSRNYSISLDMSFGAPENFIISAFLGSKKIELKPIETLSVIEGMKIIEPSESFPLRTYSPNIIYQNSVSIRDNLKPGILEQAKSFLSFAQGKSEKKLGTIQDLSNAIRSIKDIENLL
ncbi:MAG: hypothetical protein CMD08_03685 [Flavobacteriales bacterium]|nr:hypothetical protein [Flavobacteriales bacterium]